MPFLKRRRLGRSYRRKKPPADLHIIVNGIPVCLREMEMWKPGITTKMGLVEAMQWIPVFLGYTEEPMCISEMDLKPRVVPMETDEPFFQEHSAAARELVKLRLAYHKIPPENEDQRKVQFDLIQAKHTEVLDLHKKHSMISKLSQ
ncbi:hypothetical protein D3C87_650640 [compost metagenome]